MIRIKPSSGVAAGEHNADAAELIALKKSTLVSHLKLVLDSRVRGNDTEEGEGISTAPTAAEPGSDADQISEERMDVAMDEAAPWMKQRAPALSVTLPRLPQQPPVPPCPPALRVVSAVVSTVAVVLLVQGC